jgi:hypothetical protein
MYFSLLVFPSSSLAHCRTRFSNLKPKDDEDTRKHIEQYEEMLRNFQRKGLQNFSPDKPTLILVLQKQRRLRNRRRRNRQGYNEKID